MENKYLPIGTICTLKNNNKKIMVISYFSIEYNNNVIMYDYKGCVYPEGLLLPSQSVSFNHDDILSIDYIGYKNEQYEIFNNNLNRNQQEEKEYKSKPILKNFQFDENGVVIFDPTVEENLSVTGTEKSITNPFQVTENSDKKGLETKNDIFDKYKFDENGVVISDETITKKSKYTFDENGFVVSDETVTINEYEKPIVNDSKYKFDENGVVVSDSTSNETPLPKANSEYIFDENGTVIGENSII